MSIGNAIYEMQAFKEIKEAVIKAKADNGFMFKPEKYMSKASAIYVRKLMNESSVNCTFNSLCLEIAKY